jgi:hypothetical protein
MPRDYFSILGLKPGRYEPSEIGRRFATRRRRLLVELDDPTRHVESRQRLNELYEAYNVLRDPRRQAEYLRAARAEDGDEDRVARLQRLIEASLEGGLLRYSRRTEIIAEGRRLGFSEFHTQLLIAQVQFGEGVVAPPRRGTVSQSAGTPSQLGARLAAAGILALAIFLAMIRWLGT